MNESIVRGAKSTQEQAIAEWVSYLNSVRINELAAQILLQDGNLKAALSELEELKLFIGDPTHILGNPLTKHGEIAEHVHVNFSNARNAIVGLEKEYTFLDVGRTAPEDYLKNGLPVQSKYNVGVKKTLGAIRGHLEKYPGFIDEGGSYDIPNDQYAQIVDIIKRFSERKSSLSKEEYSIFQAVQRLEDETGLVVGTDIMPAVADYDQVQLGTVHTTVKKEQEQIEKTDRELRNKAQQEYAPSINEGAVIAGKSAAVEGGLSFCLAVYDKIRSGKRIFEFTEEDWREIAKLTGYGTVKGGIRGGSVYILTNFTKTPANMASAYTTAAFGILSQAIALKKGSITEDEFVLNSEIMCMDIAVSTIAATIGQTLIPFPVLGAVIGNIVGEAAYSLCQRYTGKREAELIERFRRDQESSDLLIDSEYNAVIHEINNRTELFDSLLVMAFDEDMNNAIPASIELAQTVGVPEDRILKSIEDVDRFFLG